MLLLKGNRTYLHSTDIFSFIENKYNFNQIDIKFHKFLKSQPKVILIKKLKNNHNANIVAKIKLKKDIKFLIFSETKNIIKNNYSYDENLLKNFFKFNNFGVKCNFQTTVKYIDLIVSMTKLWHVYKINKNKQWVVTRIRFNKKITQRKIKNISIKVNKIMKKKHTDSDIIIDRNFCGKIYYSALD